MSDTNDQTPLAPVIPITERDEPPQIPARGLYSEEARLERLAFMRERSGTELAELESTEFDPGKLVGNIENLVSSVDIPVGLAGPLLFKGQHARGTFYAPMATSEGALVASATRGATAITRSGGVTTLVVHQRMMRVPLFVFGDVRSAFEFVSFLRAHTKDIKAQVGEVSRHAELLSIDPHIMGPNVHVTFLYETGDAAGQNMTTACTWHCCQWILRNLETERPDMTVERFYIEGNMSGDKKVTFQSLINGRGTRVIAEAVLSDAQIERTLKTDRASLMRAVQSAMAGSIQVGMIGFNINTANVIGAMFTATGQDIACVHESSLAQLDIQEVEGGVYASMTLPALIVGTVGGGTGLPRQRALLQSIGCHGAGKAGKLAEIIAGYCLALDLSTMAAVASGQFVSAHERLGRNRPVQFFTRDDLTPDLFASTMRGALGAPALEVQQLIELERTETGSSIISELTSRKTDKFVGHVPFAVTYATEPGAEPLTEEVMVKVKPLDREVLLMTSSMIGMCSPRLASAYLKIHDEMEFRDVHTRELGVYQQTDERFTKHTPRLYGVHRDDAREAYVLVLERLKGMNMMDSSASVDGWTRERKEVVVDGLAQLQSIWLGKVDELEEQPWLGFHRTHETMDRGKPFWAALGVHAFEEFPEWFSPDDLQLHHVLVRDVPVWWAELEAMPRTLIHNDFNPRNLCLRTLDDGSERLCVYDWELATVGVPQHDLAEFLSFVCTPQTSLEELEYYSELHRKALAHYAGWRLERLDPHYWREGLIMALFDLAIHRFTMYVTAHTFRRYPFMERVMRTMRHLIRLLRGL